MEARSPAAPATGGAEQQARTLGSRQPAFGKPSLFAANEYKPLADGIQALITSSWNTAEQSGTPDQPWCRPGYKKGNERKDRSTVHTLCGSVPGHDPMPNAAVFRAKPREL